MKKFVKIMSIALPLALMSTAINAKEMKKEMPQEAPKMECPCKGGEDCKCAKKHHKMEKGMKHEMWLKKQMEEINEDFDEAIEKINKSELSQDFKKVLTKQANSNKELAMKQAKETSSQIKKNWEERKGFKEEMMKSKENKKVGKKVDKILKD